MKPPPYSFRFESDLRADFERWAKEDGRALANYIDRVLRQHAEIKRQEEKKREGKRK